MVGNAELSKSGKRARGGPIRVHMRIMGLPQPRLNTRGV